MEDLQPLHRMCFEQRPTQQSRTYELRLLIDGVDLVDLIRPVELPFATAEGNPANAGRYSGLHWPQSMGHVLLLEHYLGQPDPYYSYKGRTQILGCECGEPGCWPLVCRIVANARTVEWSDFQQCHRVGRPLPRRLRALARETDRSGLRPAVRAELALREAVSGVWTYDSIGPFVFDRAQYEEALLAVTHGAD